ncbi:DNA-3-methyladenine glycosylase family protein [Streptantibioticus silvisoli]|uniref:DNA-3-methyladenine glycosylase II n=1 Tax=Streptantibioticus silvisoli TaxID=2705255 RepID=A0ABT6W1K3_9ACTN|nr:DNA-3-methyladenine glycosylase 2 family protein [Streptantibioticus silvisoli]MDI5964628.1 DNA-3-methyladenine glycosylase 2 family protein [Streptantibioticus silvisoli]
MSTTGHPAAGRTLRLPAREPFDFGASLAFLRCFPPTAGQQGTAGGELTMALRAGGVTVGARITGAADRAGVDCLLTAGEPLGAGTVREAADRVGFHLGLDDDLTDFYQRAARDAPFTAVLDRLHGYHQVKFPSPFELLCWAILCQRVPVPAARTMRTALVEAVGNRVDVAGRTHWAFPDPGQLAAYGQPELEQLVGNSRKASYLYRSVRRWLDLDEEFLRTGPYDAVRDQLLGLPGIGPWSASFLLIRGLGRTERVAPDREMTRAAEQVYRRPVDAAQFGRLTAFYGPAQGYWAHYLRVAA